MANAIVLYVLSHHLRQANGLSNRLHADNVSTHFQPSLSTTAGEGVSSAGERNEKTSYSKQYNNFVQHLKILTCDWLRAHTAHALTNP